MHTSALPAQRHFSGHTAEVDGWTDSLLIVESIVTVCVSSVCPLQLPCRSFHFTVIVQLASALLALVPFSPLQWSWLLCNNNSRNTHTHKQQWSGLCFWFSVYNSKETRLLLCCHRTSISWREGEAMVLLSDQSAIGRLQRWRRYEVPVFPVENEESCCVKAVLMFLFVPCGSNPLTSINSTNLQTTKPLVPS